MRKIFLFGVLLFTLGCSSQKVEHDVLCNHADSKVTSFNGIAVGPVYAFVIKGRAFLWFNDSNNNPTLIDLSQNDCGVN